MSKKPFELHSQLANDCAVVTELPLCKLLLLNDSRYPWLVLVPRRADIREVYELPDDEQQQLWQEVTQVGEQLMAANNGHKLNIGALGNMVPQLHVHVIVRQPDDSAWPGPVWGVGTATPYTEDELQSKIAELRSIV